MPKTKTEHQRESMFGGGVEKTLLALGSQSDVCFFNFFLPLNFNLSYAILIAKNRALLNISLHATGEQVHLCLLIKESEVDFLA